MWHSYFSGIRKKYSMRVSKKLPLVIRFDGKDVTKEKEINFLYDYNGSFTNVLKKCAVKCYAILGTDEINFILPDPMPLLLDLDDECDNYSNELISLFSQYFYDYFNMFYKDRKIFFHGKCFSIPTEKITSYIKWRSGVIKNVLVTYVIKKNGIKMTDEKLSIKSGKCKELPEYETLKDMQNGILYYNGKRLNVNDFFNGNEVYIKDNEESKFDLTNEQDDIEIEFTDL